MKFKKGNRVRVYGNLGTDGLPPRDFDYYAMGSAGKVDCVGGNHEDDEIWVTLDEGMSVTSGCTVLVHPKQCRKLRKKRHARK